jgi:hypothetical protein
LSLSRADLDQGALLAGCSRFTELAEPGAALSQEAAVSGVPEITIATVDFPGARHTAVFGINGRGDMVGFYQAR